MSRRRVCGPLSCSPLSLGRGDPVSFGAPKGVTPAVAGTAGACSDSHTGHARLVDRARELQYCRWPEASLRGRRSRLRGIELQPLLTKLPATTCRADPLAKPGLSRVALVFCFCCCGCCLFCFVSFLKLWELSVLHLEITQGSLGEAPMVLSTPRLAVHSNRPELPPLGCQLREV